MHDICIDKKKKDIYSKGFPGGSADTNLPASAEDAGLIPFIPDGEDPTMPRGS